MGQKAAERQFFDGGHDGVVSGVLRGAKPDLAPDWHEAAALAGQGGRCPERRRSIPAMLAPG
jgi:hypothetical protein